jgi:signal transduction histidine kinase
VKARNRPRVLIADDHTLVAEACKNLLEGEFDVVGIVGDGRALIEAASVLTPDVAVVDICMPRMNGLDAGEQIRNMKRTIKVVYLTMNQDPSLAAAAFRRGASAFLLKSSAASELLDAIRAVLNGRHYVSRLIANDYFDLSVEYANTTATPGRLTDRQRQVLQLLSEGRSMKEVAGLLNLTPRTVAFHKYRIKEVLHLKNNSELVQYAIHEHLIPPMPVSPIDDSGDDTAAVQEPPASHRAEPVPIRELGTCLIQAQEQERSRIARELHDDISQQLGLLEMEIQQLEKTIPKTAVPVRAGMEEIWKKTREISQDVQRISRRLHSTKLEHLGLSAALKGLLTEFSNRHKFVGSLQVRNVPDRLDSDLSLTLFRVAQEALNNAAKHSGAKHVNVRLTSDSGGVVLRISDDGSGFENTDSPAAGLGMISMNERVRYSNGNLSITSKKGVGTQVEAWIPFPQPIKLAS